MLKTIHGLPEDAEIIPDRLHEFVHPDDREQFLNDIAHLLSPDSREFYEHEFRIVRTDGEIRWLLDTGRVFFTGNGEHRNVDLVIGITHDITDRKRAEAQLRRAAEMDAFRVKLSDALRSLSDPEEIKYQAVCVLGKLLGTDRTFPSAHRERLELAHRNSLRLLKLVNTLLDFSRIESGRIEAVYEPTDLSAFTSELASVFRSAIEQAGLRLIVDCLPLSEAVYVDREMWEKIVLNSISNAFKFTLAGEISLRLHSVDSHVILEVQDTGVGIAPEDVPHLFERFYQVRGAQARSHEGSGIRLALVRELVQLHGATINVSSTLGRGTCFTIALPFGSEHLPQKRIKTSRALASIAIGAAPYVQEAELWRSDENREMPSNARILIVAERMRYFQQFLTNSIPP